MLLKTIFNSFNFMVKELIKYVTPKINTINKNNRTTSTKCRCQAQLQNQNVQKSKMIYKNLKKQTIIKIVPIKTGNHEIQLHEKSRSINSSAILKGALYSYNCNNVNIIANNIVDKNPITTF